MFLRSVNIILLECKIIDLTIFRNIFYPVIHYYNLCYHKCLLHILCIHYFLEIELPCRKGQEDV